MWLYLYSGHLPDKKIDPEMIIACMRLKFILCIFWVFVLTNLLCFSEREGISGNINFCLQVFLTHYPPSGFSIALSGSYPETDYSGKNFISFLMWERYTRYNIKNVKQSHSVFNIIVVKIISGQVTVVI